MDNRVAECGSFCVYMFVLYVLFCWAKRNLRPKHTISSRALIPGISALCHGKVLLALKTPVTPKCCQLVENTLYFFFCGSWPGFDSVSTNKRENYTEGQELDIQVQMCGTVHCICHHAQEYLWISSLTTSHLFRFNATDGIAQIRVCHRPLGLVKQPPCGVRHGLCGQVQTHQGKPSPYRGWGSAGRVQAGMCHLYTHTHTHTQFTTDIITILIFVNGITQIQVGI